MPYYQWVGIDIGGNTRKGFQFSASRQDLEQELFVHEIAVYKVEQTQQASRKKWSRHDVGEFFNHLAILLKSGIFLTDALDIIASLTHKNHVSLVIQDITTQVHKGRSLSAALSLHDGCFDRISIAMIQSAQESGNIVEALEHITTHIEFMEHFYKKLRSAALIPAVTFSFFLCITAIVMIFIIPQFAGLFRDHYHELPFITRAMICVSQFLNDYLWVILPSIMLSILSLKKSLQSDLGQYCKHWLLFRVPFIKKIIIQMNILSFLESLGLLLKGDISLVPAINLAQQIIGQADIAQWCTAIEQDIKNGSSFHAALRAHNEIDKELIAMIKIGEESGRLPHMIEHGCRVYEAKISKYFELVTVLFQPIIMLLIGGFVALLVFALYVPLFQLSNLINVGF